MFKKALFILLISSISLISCSEEQRIRVFKNGNINIATPIEDKTIELANLDKYKIEDYLIKVTDFYTILNMIDRKDSFIYLIKSQTCSHCLNTLANIMPFAYNSKQTIYFSDFIDIVEDYHESVSAYSAIFDKEIGTPQLYFIKNGELFAKDNHSQFNSTYELLKKYFDIETINDSTSSYFTSLEAFNNSMSNSTAIFINSNNLYSYYTTQLKNMILLSKNEYLIFDTAFVSPTDMNKLKNTYDISETFNFDLGAIKVENKIKTSSIEYSQTNQVDFEKYLGL
ncbi:MAG: hypothetical protein RSB95_00130 [Bacilli bacterium]